MQAVIGRESESFHRGLDRIAVLLYERWIVKEPNRFRQGRYRPGATVLPGWY